MKLIVYIIDPSLISLLIFLLWCRDPDIFFFFLHITDYRKWMNENYPSILEGKYGPCKKLTTESGTIKGCLVDLAQTRTQLPLIYSRKGIWNGNLWRPKTLGKEEGKVTSCFSSILPLMHRELTKSFP